MSDIQKLPLKDACFLCLLYVKFAMEGDIESGEPLRELFERYSTIDWESPQFIVDSEAMRGTPVIPPADISNADVYQAIAASQREQLAARSEDISLLYASLQSAMGTIEQGIKDGHKHAKLTSELFDYIDKLTAVTKAMGDQLNMLGEDTSIYEFPLLPQAPKN